MKYVDLFAGIGGLSLPFKELGYECVFASEIDKFAALTYETNHGHKPHGDITQIKASEIPQHDLLLAGFPCQAFSRAGKQLGFLDTRGTLFFDVLRIAKYHKPKVILLENVAGLVGHDKGKTFSIIKSSLEELGYVFNYKILNSKDFGLAQSRKRIYMVASQKEFIFPDSLNIKTNVSSILESHVDGKHTLSDLAWVGIQRRANNMKDKYNHISTGFGFNIVNDKDYVGTITKNYKEGKSALIEQVNKNPRRLTVREIARLFGYKEDFIFPCSDRQSYMQLGNSVAINVVRELAREINKQFFANVINL